MKGQSIRLIITTWVAIACLTACLPFAGAVTGPPDAYPSTPCDVIAFTHDPSINHYSLILNESIIFGRSLYVQSSCDSITVNSEGSPLVISNSSLIGVEIPLRSSSISIDWRYQNETGSLSFSNLTVLRAGAVIEAVYAENPELDPNARSFTTPELIAYENWIVAAGSILSGLVATVGLWGFIKTRHDGGFCEEVSA